jgi:predicted enzyme related to lactoylglutathione lyase
MARVVHFEISVDDAERACRFYNNVFGWQTRKWGESGVGYFAYCEDTEGNTFGIMQADPGASA